MPACNCQDWQENYPDLDRVQCVAWAHSAGYKGKVFHFCPWCGGGLSSEKPRVDPEVRALIEAAKQAERALAGYVILSASHPYMPDESQTLRILREILAKFEEER